MFKIDSSLKSLDVKRNISLPDILYKEATLEISAVVPG